MNMLVSWTVSFWAVVLVNLSEIGKKAHLSDLVGLFGCSSSGWSTSWDILWAVSLVSCWSLGLYPFTKINTNNYYCLVKSHIINFVLC